MMIGPEHCGYRSIDEVGVPSGGPYGDAKWFSRKAGSLGLGVAWSDWLESFVLYSPDGAKVITQFIFRNHDGRPVPLDSATFWAIERGMEQAARNGDATLQVWRNRQRISREKRIAAMREAALAERRARTYEMRRDLDQALSLELGRTPTAMFDMRKLRGR